MPLYIRKFSGEKEIFDIEKFRISLKRSGASTSLIEKLVYDIEHMPKLRSTREIYSYALNLLQREHTAAAMRYNIKRALLELGPAGFSFEQFIAKLYEAQGFRVETDIIKQGLCVEHELDIIAHQDSHQLLIECKFHNYHYLKTDVKVTLYCKARFDDIKKFWENEPGYTKISYSMGLVTNTRFTSEAIRYATCSNINLLGWSYPPKDNLQSLIDRYKLYPITAITSLSRSQKRLFINKGFVLCKDARSFIPLMHKCGLDDEEIEKLLKDTHELCSNGNK